MARPILFRDINELVSLDPAAKSPTGAMTSEDLGVVSKAALLAHRGCVLWVGKEAQLKGKVLKKLTAGAEIKEVSLKGRNIMPGFVECHTHSVFAGNRSEEFELRNQGVTYQEIARRGGGIISTVKATRKASVAKLTELAQQRVDRFTRQGVTTLEIKSGYGLDTKSECKMLTAAARVKGPRVVKTFLGLHAVAPEFASVDEYCTYALEEMLPRVLKAHLADRLDIFVEKSYFTLKHLKQLSDLAIRHKLPLAVHADQLSRTGSSALAAKLGAVSVDHAVEITSADIKKMATTEVTAVLLPGADYYLKVKYPPARKLIAAGVNVALATDFNPGSCPTQDLSFVGLLARLEMKMTLPECLRAYTLGAARALGLGNQVGSLSEGKCCDFAVLDGDHRDLFYQVGYHPVVETWKSGKKISKK